MAPRSRLLYVPTPKVACTSLKTAVVSLEGAWTGVDPAGPELTEQQLVHDRAVHSLKSLAMLTAVERAEVLSGASWVRFCVTRNPYDRTVSAWVNRILLGVLGAPLGEQFSVVRAAPDLSSGVVDLGAMFRSFVHQLPSNSRQLADVHFAPQVSLLDVERFPYTHVVDLSGVDDLLAELRASGSSRSGLVLGPRANEGLHVRPADLYDAETAAIVESVYTADFDRFGYVRRSFPSVATPLLTTSNEVALMAMVRARNDRVRALSNLARSRATGRAGMAAVARAARARVERMIPLSRARRR